MRKIFLRLGTALIVLALAVTGIVVAVSADAPTTAYTQTATITGGIYYSPHLVGTAAKGDNNIANPTVKSNDATVAALYGQGVHSYYSVELLYSPDMAPLVLYYRSASANVKTGAAKISKTGNVTANGVSTQLSNGWNHLSVDMYQTHTITDGVVSYTLHFTIYVNGTLLTSYSTAAATNGTVTSTLYDVTVTDGVGTVTKTAKNNYWYLYIDNSKMNTASFGFEHVRTAYAGYGTTPGITSVPLTMNLNGGAFPKTAYTQPAVTIYPEITYQVDNINQWYCLNNTAVTLPTGASAPVREGYEFTGWYSDADCTTAVTEIAAGQTTAQTVYAGWSAIGSSVAFSLDGGTNPDGAASFYLWNAEAQNLTLPTPTKTNFNFNGWYTDAALSDGPYTGTYSIAANCHDELTFYASWTQTHGAISYDVGTATVTPVLTAYPLGTATDITLPAAPVLSGYTFLGWYDNIAMTGTRYEASGTYSLAAADAGTSGITFYAKMGQNTAFDASDAGQTSAFSGYNMTGTGKYTIPFTYEDGIGRYAYNKTATNEDAVINWNTTAETGIKTIEFRLWGDGSGTFLPLSMRFNGSGDYKTRKETYFFELTADGTMKVRGTVIGKLTASSAETAPLITLILDLTVPGSLTIDAYLDGIQCAKDFTVSANNLRTTDSTDPTDTDKVMKMYWYSSTSSTGVINVDNFYMIDGYDLEGTALNTKYMNTVSGSKITYVDAGTLPDGAPANTVYGTATALPTPSKTGYTFGGWYLNPEFTGDAVTTIAADDNDLYVLYAKYTGNYSVTYVVNGIAAAPVTGVCDITLPDTAAYWVSSTGEILAGGAAVTLGSNATYYALSVDLLDGAAVRLNTPTGLRFETAVDEDLFTILSGIDGATVTVGTLIVPTDKLVGAFTAEALTAASIDFKNLSSALGGVTASGGSYTFYASLVDILAANYCRKFSATSYITVTLADSSTYTVYTEYTAANNARSIYEVATAAYADSGNYNNDQLAVIRSFLDKVVVLTVSEGTLAIGNNTASYTSPYAISYATGTLTVTKTDSSAIADGDIATVLIGDKAYTGGWTIASGALTAPYTVIE